MVFIIITGLFIGDLIDQPQWWTDSSNWFWLIISIHGWGAIGYYIYYKFSGDSHPKRKIRKGLARKKAEITSPAFGTEIFLQEPDKKTEKSVLYKKITEEINVDLERAPLPLHMKLCPFCGAENEDTAHSCVKCNVWFPE